MRAHVLLRRAFLIAVVAVVCAAAFTFSGVDRVLVRAESPRPADAILVLAGDVYGKRILKGAELARQGFAPVVLVSGGPAYYGVQEPDLAIAFAGRHGYPPSLFVPLPNDVTSTRDEVRALAPEIKRRGIARLLAVTSDYHTRRAGMLLRAALPGVEITVVAAPDLSLRPAPWWKTREGRKCVYYEISKLAAEWLGA